MRVRLDAENSMVLDTNSGRIRELQLSGKVVMRQSDEGTGSGNFLMFPWVNRVEVNPFLPVES